MIFKDNNKFDINSVKMLYSMPSNSFALINDENISLYEKSLINFIFSKLEKKKGNLKSEINFFRSC